MIATSQSVIIIITLSCQELGRNLPITSKRKWSSYFNEDFPILFLIQKYTELILKKTWIKVMPTKNIKDIRGYMDSAYLFIDEADFFSANEQEALEPAITAYEEKSKARQ